MKHTHAHNSLLTLSIVVFLMTAALYVYMYIAVNSQTLRVVLAKDVQKVQKLDTEQMENIQDLFSHSEPARDKLHGLFVAKDQAVPFIESLEALGTVTGANVDITSINEVKDETQNKGQFRAHVEARGTWNQVMKVLVLAETMQKSVAISGVRLNGETTNASSSANKWSLSLDTAANILQ